MFISGVQYKVTHVVDDNIYCLHLGVTLHPVLVWMSSQHSAIIYEEWFETWNGACTNFGRTGCANIV